MARGERQLSTRPTEWVGRGRVGHVGTRSRGGKSTARQLVGVYGIEGESLTTQQVADRLGVRKRTAARLLQRERAKAGPVTWAGLGLLSLALSGCSWFSGGDSVATVTGAGGTASVQLVTLEDGTRCAVLVGNRGAGGIDCDWQGRGAAR